MSRPDPWAADKATPEAQAKRERRQQLRNQLPNLLCRSFDPLVVRQRLVHYWRGSGDGMTRFGPPCRPLYSHPGFRNLLLPGIRPRAARRYGRSVSQIMAEQRKPTLAPQMGLFEGAQS